ncbi:hypothetical protein CAOG_010234, partial [Capsaspora owczarzaki ATCC 30864]
DLAEIKGTIAKLKAQTVTQRDEFINQQVNLVYDNWYENEVTKNSPRPYYFVMYDRVRSAILAVLNQ